MLGLSDIGNEDLRAQVKTLQYEIEALKQERDVTTLRHEKDLRDAQARGEADFKRAQASESSKHVTTHKYDALARELKDAQDGAANQKHDLEKKLRVAQDRAKALQDDVDDARTEVASLTRQHAHRLQEVEAKHAKGQQTLEEVQSDLTRHQTALQNAAQQIARREAEVGELEGEVLKLRGQEGGGEELATVKRELTEQVAYIRELETKDRAQTAELRQLRQTHKAVAIVEEEKRTLAVKVRRMDDLEREIGEERFQRERLEQERRAWAAFLQNGSAEGEREFDSPEAVARALAEERSEKASLLDRLGALQPEVTEKEGMIQSLESARAKLQSELDQLKASGGTMGGSASSESRSKARLERQKALAVKEVEYLRAQLRTFEAEDATGEVQVSVDEQTKKRIASLEDLVANYRKEVEGLQIEFSMREPQAPSEPQSRKRSAPDDAETARAGELSRKNRKLQSDVSALTKDGALARSELAATKSQLAALQASSKTRVLSLRSNPTDDFHAIKLSTITALREENKTLHAAQASSQTQQPTTRGKTVPASYFDAANAEIAELQAAVADREKRALRLKQVWSQKSLEFREAVASLLGWQMDFMPNGRFRMTSLFYPSTAEPGGEESTGNSIIFNGDTGIMKIGGGADSPFGREIRPLIRFWVEERKEIPAFLAACTLEFYEKTTRAQRM